MNNDLKSFYYNILNISGGESNSFNIIKEEIAKMRKYLEDNKIDTDNMCIVISRILSNNLDMKNISNKIVNTKDLFGCYEHEFVLAHYNKDEDIECILIDLTYSQFDSKDKQLITNKMKTFPTELLQNSHVLLDLLENGYSKINNEDFKKYLYSIHQNPSLTDKISIEDIIYRGVLKK